MNLKKAAFIALVFICALPYFGISAAIGLALGIAFALILGNPFEAQSRKLSKYLLQASVVGLGFRLNISKVLEIGTPGLILAIISVVFTMCIGLLLGRLLKTSKELSYLISAGTAICGGSAIAALAPVIKEVKQEHISISIGIVFILNAIALFIFPSLGHYLGFSEEAFGFFSAIAIHDTSSVVGAASIFGDGALDVAVTVKLARTLLIIPMIFITLYIFSREEEAATSKVKIPWFIAGFILAVLFNTYAPGMESISANLVFISKRVLVAVLFLIGSQISLPVLKSIGAKPFAQGVLLWLIVTVASAGAIGAIFNSG